MQREIGLDPWCGWQAEHLRGIPARAYIKQIKQIKQKPVSSQGENCQDGMSVATVISKVENLVRHVQAKWGSSQTPPTPETCEQQYYSISTIN